ncbi:MAG: cyclodeaminase/cyclohydrolase family protein [Ruminococcaceae bacterium]|nr:cyclodeaminase/cyclohydrolase family protein [Oscillospiraceae bacterium]
MKLIDMTVSDYLNDLASVSPAPGGGSAAALCGAQGAGLAAMVASFTIGRKKYAEFEENAIAVRDAELVLTEKLKAQIDKDTEAFNLVAAAFKLPKATDEEKAERSRAIQAGTLVSTEVPFETMVLALEALKTAEKLLSGFNDGAASDLGVAAFNLLTCVRGAWLNVGINIGSLKDKEVAESFRTRGQEILREAEEIAARIAGHTDKIIFG